MDTVKIGERIREARLKMGLSQAKLADELDVSYQSVSLWENGQLPTTDKLIRVAEVLGVSLTSLVEEKYEAELGSSTVIFDVNHMRTFIKTKAQALGMKNTLKALSLAVEAHKNQTRKTNTKAKKGEEEVPYIYHPLTLACGLFSMGVNDDEVIASALLHDVLEDCVMLSDGKLDARSHAKHEKLEYRDLTEDDLDCVNENVRHLVGLLTHTKENGADREKVMTAYYKAIAREPKAALIKCADRVNNLGSMVWGLSRERMYRQITETEKYFPQLLKAIKNEPEYNDQAWQFTYQMKTLLDVYKRLI